MDQLPLENFEKVELELLFCQNTLQLPLENFEKVELELLFCQNTLSVSFCQKLVSCGENV
jgi:hypothetical protein